MERLEELWRNLWLTEDESSMKDKEDRSLFEKVWLDRLIGKEIMSSTKANVWRVSWPAKFQEVGNNIFIITFSTHANKVKVLEGHPWLFDNHLFMLQMFDAFAQPSKLLFEREVFWV